MAVAYFNVTGNTKAIDAACKWADMLILEKNSENLYFKNIGQTEHPEIEFRLDSIV